MKIKMALIVLIALAAVFSGARAQSLKFINANYPGIYCHFSSDCQVSPAAQSASFTPTNVAATCVLESRSFAGNSMGSTGQYGYEYRLTLNNNGGTDTGIFMVNSLTLNFGAPETFAFGEHASNQVWVVTTGGPIGLVPDSAELDGSNIVFHFNPPLSLATKTDQSTNSCYFGMISGSAPEMTGATLDGSTQDPVNGTASFETRLQAQTP